MNHFFSRLFPPKLEPEAIQCYINRLPEQIQVSWKRDEDGLLVGRVSIGNNRDDSFWTQGKNVKDFLYMINDAVFIALDFKPEYIPVFHRMISYAPTEGILKRLSDESMKEGSFGISKSEKEFVTA